MIQQHMVVLTSGSSFGAVVAACRCALSALLPPGDYMRAFFLLRKRHSIQELSEPNSNWTIMFGGSIGTLLPHYTQERGREKLGDGALAILL